MVILADKNDKTYKNGSMYYNNKTGFVDKERKNWDVYAYENVHKNGYYELAAFIHEDGWKEITRKIMTIDEIEKELGYEIEIAEE
jgi:hypothetical protein